TPVVDYNGDGVDEIFWGERCISIDDGSYLFIADEGVYSGHSDVIQPTLDRRSGEWLLFTCRESGESPRVVMFGNEGERMWSDLERGHMDMGWTAQVESEACPVIAFTISRGGKIAGPDGFHRLN